MKVILGTLILSLAAVTTTYAGGRDGPWNGYNPFSGRPTAAAPEIDPASAGSALTLLAGGLAVIRGRRSKSK